MRFITTNHIASAIVAATLSLPVAAWAASDTTPAATTGGAAVAGSHQEKVEQRIADMHATLHITEAQEPQWDSFAQVMLDNAQAMETVLGKNAGTAPTRTATEIMQSYAEIAAQHAQNVQKLSTAFDTVYAGLTADQQKAADEMFRVKADEHAQKQGG
jgi:periplasmic protein CpxP/Spy